MPCLVASRCEAFLIRLSHVSVQSERASSESCKKAESSLPRPRQREKVRYAMLDESGDGTSALTEDILVDTDLQRPSKGRFVGEARAQ